MLVVTIRDIAREAGVSVSTVSRVLTGKPDVSAATGDRVQAVVDRYHFEVNRHAQYLKQVDTCTIGVVVKGRDNVLFATMLELVQTAVVEAGFRTAVRYLDEDDDGLEAVEAERLASEFKPRGVIVLGGDLRHEGTLQRRVGVEIPAVVLTTQLCCRELPLVSSVSVDDAAAGRMAVAHLIANGHRVIGVISGNPDTSEMSHHRLQGAKDALRDAGLALDGRVALARYSLESGYQAAIELVGAHPDITALYAMSDLMALGAIRALADLGRRVPDDISVIGHDGIALGSYTLPRLTTLRQPQEEIVRQGLARLLDDATPAASIIVPVELVPGESVRAL